ncbi:MAG TPA: hypothetical protein VGL40_03610, partial [Bacillota bacterium]
MSIRTKRKGLVAVVFALVLVLGQPALAQAAVPTPESVLGYSIGADYHLTEWAKIVDYFDQL